MYASFIKAGIAVALACAAGLSAAWAVEPHQRDTHGDVFDAVFQQALRECRRKQPGRLNRRLKPSPWHHGVARCLERAGWRPDGSRIEG